jgi:GNAT superfamily N-acetyltransferase
MGFSVKRLDVKEEIYDFLKKDRLYAAYAICDLEPALFRQCEWYASSTNGQLTTLCLLFSGLPPDRVFLMGSAEGLAPILRGVLKTTRAFLACRPHHLDAVSRHYSLRRVEVMHRMVLRPEAFECVDGPVERLGPGHARHLQDLYRSYGDVAFAPYQLEHGVFYGIEQDGRLVATAGTHLVSRTYGLGIVGNVFTLPEYRGMGYATMCTSAVVEELLPQSLDVVLNVGQNNKTASKVYHRLGFDVYCSFTEILAVRKEVE